MNNHAPGGGGGGGPPPPPPPPPPPQWWNAVPHFLTCSDYFWNDFVYRERFIQFKWLKLTRLVLKNVLWVLDENCKTHYWNLENTCDKYLFLSHAHTSDALSRQTVAYSVSEHSLFKRPSNFSIVWRQKMSCLHRRHSLVCTDTTSRWITYAQRPESVHTKSVNHLLTEAAFKRILSSWIRIKRN